MVKKGLTEKVTFGERLKGGKRSLWGEVFKAEETANGKVLRNSKRSLWDRVKQGRKGGTRRGRDTERERREWSQNIQFLLPDYGDA